MIYKNELDLIIDGFKKCRLNAVEVKLDEDGFFRFRMGLERVFGLDIPKAVIGNEVKAKCLYKACDAMKLSYRYFLLPERNFPTVLFIGPYLEEALSISEVFEIGEKNGVLPSRQRFLEEYYSTLPIFSSESKIFFFLDSFLERIFKSPAFAIINADSSELIPASPMGANKGEGEDAVARMKTVEKRYEFENELIHAVTLGQSHKESQLFGAFSDAIFEKRSESPLRNIKNYGIIMNTLLRKAAETGGVHPVYIDRISSDFAFKIESMKTLSGSISLMTEMFRGYCALVRNHSLKKYSPLVRAAIVLIDSDLSAQLSLKTLAEKQNVSSGYLSAAFHKETGKTVTEYIRERRMENAEYLLATTSLEVQTVALHSGILDLQYFSKLFKKHTGKTPREYRENLKNKN